MKAKRILTVMLGFLWMAVCSSPATAAFDSGSTGADGAFNPTASTELQIPESGVFNFTTVNIPSGVTITFKKNSQNTPVTILATGDVTIVGKLYVSGSPGNGPAAGFGGPGGLDGGFGGTQSGDGGKGLGPGGGNPGLSRDCWYYRRGFGGGGGGFNGGGANGNGDCSVTATGGPGYSNDRIIPLIGGSGGGGGGGGGSFMGGGGGGSGGAILIASSGTVNITGELRADGGTGGLVTATSCCSGSGGGGSGGAIRIIANRISGNGTISASYANGGGAPGNVYGGGNSAWGRIRLETYDLQRTAGTSPGYSFGYPGTVTTTNLPTLKVTSIGGITVPTTPTGSYATPDIALPVTATNPVTVGIEASYIPTNATVTVTVVPQFGVPATATATLTGALESSTGSVNVTLSSTYPSIITLTSTFTVQTASNEAPLYAEGEKVVKMRVASVMGGKSTVTYITESGREVEARL